jgi:hypothetical protein
MNPFKIGLAIVFMGGFAYGIITLSFQNAKLESQLDIARNYQSQLNEQTNVNIRRLLEFEEQLGKLKSQLLSATSQLTSLSAELEEAKQQSNPSYEALLEKARMEIASGTPRQLQHSASPMRSFANPDTARAMAADYVPKMYENFINTLGLPGTERQEIIVAMIEYRSKRYQMFGSLIEGSLSTNDAIAIFGSEGLTDSVDNLLTEDQLRGLSQYNALVQKDSARHVFAESLSRLGNTMGEDTQRHVLDVLLDEIYSPQNNYGAIVAEDGSMISAYNNQLDAYDRARVILLEEINGDQLQQFDRFVDERSSGVDIMLEATTDGSGGVAVRNFRVGVDDLPQ